MEIKNMMYALSVVDNVPVCANSPEFLIQWASEQCKSGPYTNGVVVVERTENDEVVTIGIIPLEDGNNEVPGQILDKPWSEVAKDVDDGDYFFEMCWDVFQIPHYIPVNE